MTTTRSPLSRLTRPFAAVAIAGALVLSAGAGAQARGLEYANCDALVRDYPHGVAKSDAAAAAQVRAGYGRPATGKRAKQIYHANSSNLDRDKDGTACER